MSYEAVIVAHKTKEQALRGRYGARGKTFADALYSVESKLPLIVVVGLREFGRVRNKLNHQVEFGPELLPVGFEELGSELLSRLETNDPTAAASVTPAVETASSCCVNIVTPERETVVLCGTCGSIHKVRRTHHLERIQSAVDARTPSNVEALRRTSTVR